MYPSSSLPGRPFDFTALPKNEKRFGFDACNLIMMLSNYIERFQACIHLDAFCANQMYANPDSNQRHTLRIWRTIAQRGAGITLFDFKQAMVHVKTIISKSSTIGSHVSIKNLEEPVKKFSIHFPDAKRVRNALGHPSDVLASPQRNAFPGSLSLPGIEIKDAKNVQFNARLGDLVCMIIEGTVRSFKLNIESLNLMKEIKEEFDSAFEKLAIFLKENPASTEFPA